jgi:hypothetical protein
MAPRPLSSSASGLAYAMVRDRMTPDRRCEPRNERAPRCIVVVAMIDNVTNLTEWRVGRALKARRREIIVARVAGVSVAPAAPRSDPDCSLRSALVFDLKSHVAGTWRRNGR